MPTLNPATVKEIMQTSAAGPQDVELAVSKTRAAFDQRIGRGCTCLIAKPC